MQDWSYMSQYDNIIPLEEPDIRSDIIADRIRRFTGDRARLKERQVQALRVTDELLNYDAIVARTLSIG